MTAMLFAAGLGTRLRPLTNDRPKALVEVGGKTLLEWNLRKLADAGFTRIIVNVHYFADLVQDFIEAMDLPNVSLVLSDERAQLLETGGGLLKAKDWLSDGPFLVHNVDILSNVDLKALMKQHQQHQHLATLCVSKRRTSRYLLFHAKTQQLVGWKNVTSGEERPARPYRPQDVQERAFSGIYVLEPAIFDFMPAEVGTKFSIIDTLLLAAKTATITSYDHDHTAWVDVGKPAAIPAAEKLVAKW